MSNPALGSGLYLDENFDFDVGATGDLQSVDGSDELQKDLAFQLVFALDAFTGSKLTPEIVADIKSITVDILLADSRVNSVDRGSIVVRRPDRDSIGLSAVVIASGEERELVFTI